MKSKSLASALALMAVLAGTRPAQATWSIAAVDNQTGEVGVALTSCVPLFTGAQTKGRTFYGKAGVGVIVSQGGIPLAGATDVTTATLQQKLGSSATDIMKAYATWASTKPCTLGTSPTCKLLPEKQYGIAQLDQVRTSGQVGSWTGPNANFCSTPFVCATPDPYRGQRPAGTTVGSGILAGGNLTEMGNPFGRYSYTVQGNTLTSANVLSQATVAFRGGCDLADSLVRALEAGAANGEGDARCRQDPAKGGPSSIAYLAVLNPDPSKNILISSDHDDQNALSSLISVFRNGGTDGAGTMQPAHVCSAPFVPECSDGIDNDGDGKCDFNGCPSGCTPGTPSCLPRDPDCGSPSDVSEKPDCNDGIDNNGDGYIDYPADALCNSPNDESEDYDCRDGFDNDGDGKIDFAGGPNGEPADPGCGGEFQTIENPQCDDGQDNDGDNTCDYAGCNGMPPDPGCLAPYSNNESYVLPKKCKPTAFGCCGMGFEVALALPALMYLRTRRRRRKASK
jgi:hypothetical protein